MSDRYARVSATVTYDGRQGPAWLKSGIRLKFRLDDMPHSCFLPNMGMEIDGIIQHGDSASARIDVIADEGAWPLLKPGARFTLHDSPSEVVAHGSVEAVQYPVEDPLSEESYGTR